MALQTLTNVLNYLKVEKIDIQKVEFFNIMHRVPVDAVFCS